MRSQFTVLILCLATLGSVGCNRPNQPAAAAASQPAAVTALDMSKYAAMAPVKLLDDPVFGKQYAAIVPVLQRDCVKSTLASMGPLALDNDGNAVSVADGSHADNWVTAYVAANKDGALEIVLSCEDIANTNAPLFDFTSRGVQAPISAGLKEWLDGHQGGTLIVFDGKDKKDYQIDALLGTAQAAASQATLFQEVAVSEESFASIAGRLKVVDIDGQRGLRLKGQKVPGVVDSHVELKKAFRSAQGDVVLVGHNCGGSGCGYTAIDLLLINASGSIGIIPDKMTAQSDVASIATTPKPDGSIAFAFTGQQGPEAWVLKDGNLTKQ
jgi:hypothetical protein